MTDRDCFALPKCISVNGREYAIRTDFRDVLKILSAFSDPELTDGEMAYICLLILIRDFDGMPKEDYGAAFSAAIEFIDHGIRQGGKKPVRTMDWEQDAGIMFPAINKVAGFEIRSAKYIHWWTFIGWYMEISDGVFSQVLNLRAKKAHGKKLEKWEREFWDANRNICVLAPKLSAEEQAAKDRLNRML